MKQPFSRPSSSPCRARNCGVKVPLVGSQRGRKTAPGSGFRAAFDPSVGRVRAYVAPASYSSSLPSSRRLRLASNSIQLQQPRSTMQQQRLQQQRSTTHTAATAAAAEEVPSSSSSKAAAATAVVPADVCKAAIGSIVHAQSCPGCLDKRCLNGRRLLGMLKTHRAKCTIRNPGSCAQCGMIAQVAVLVQQTREALQQRGEAQPGSAVPAILPDDGARTSNSTVTSCA